MSANPTDQLGNSATGLSRHNPQLQGPKIEQKVPPKAHLALQSAISCTGNSDRVLELAQNSLSFNTQVAYLSDLQHFLSWGGQIPATSECVAESVAAHAETLSIATLSRRVAALARIHRSQGVDNPTTSELVRSVLRGLKRAKGTAQREAKPLLKDDLFLVLAATGERLKDIRDRALLLVGFAGALRRSELVGLDIEDVEYVRQGIILHLRRSKTDQEGRGEKIGIPLGRGRWCPVAALAVWLEASGITAGAVFRPVDRHGRVEDMRLSGEAVGLILRERVEAAGFDPTSYSGHSLRAGLATSAAQADVPMWRIRSQTRHASDAMLARYIRAGELITDNAAGMLL
ncbi:site-specific integrase [Bradyrhizobium sp. CB82]|uniref:site-specific integrase n=1 Tax=Bradyrhizobium sp. CB82 TaxID=3039159 RepID=UPI0024B07C49|nr:site-specific integrase [Bradyrhizobium sp. CB82]WFU41783.1 site-specific integrase [Bradyrhizobium sp. CB82]